MGSFITGNFKILIRLHHNFLKHGSPVSDHPYFSDPQNNCFINSISASSDGRWALSGGSDATVIFWDCSNPENLVPYRLKGHVAAINSVAMTPDGKWGLSGADDGSVNLWNLQGDSLQIRSQSLIGHTNRVESVAITPDGKFALTGSSDPNSKVTQWDLRDLENIHPYE